MPPYLTKRSPWFSFLVHPRGLEDLDHFSASSLLRRYSESEQEYLEKSYSMKPFVAANLQIRSTPAWGELVAVMRPPEVLMTSAGRQEVHAAVDVALSRGTKVVGLGALTSPATGGGQTLLAGLPRGVTITNGNAYTAAVVRGNVVEASQFLGLGNAARVGVVGCTGSVGAAASQLLAEAGFPLLLIGRTLKRALHLLPELQSVAEFSGDLEALAQVEIVVLLTSDPTALLVPEHLRPGTVVIDCAQPANVTAPAPFEARGIRVREGGVVRIPGFHCDYDFRFEHPEETFACMAETYLYAREGIATHSVGRASAVLAREMEAIADRRGVSPRPLRLEGTEPALRLTLEPADVVALTSPEPAVGGRAM